MRQAVKLYQSRFKTLTPIVLIVATGKKTMRLHISEDQAMHLSNRLQAYAKGQQDAIETVIELEVLA